MYNMEIKVLGFKARVEVIVISVVIGMLLCSHLICGCATQEGMEVAGAAIGYKMNDGVHNDNYDAKVDMDEVAGGAKYERYYVAGRGHAFCVPLGLRGAGGYALQGRPRVPEQLGVASPARRKVGRG